jgi:tRNA-dihydrouridine synthase C
MLILAPMEGLLDFVLRDILTRAGGIDRCVSEFIRVSNTVLPARVFERIVPELHNGGRTFAGVPVRPQLLGCPAKVVNRHGGGAALLEDPELLHRILRAVRVAVPAHMPVSAKMRLGLHDDTRAEECALALEAGGAGELVVHARTKADAYRPPAYWERIADIRAVVQIPVIANGEIWNVEDALRCRALSGCSDLMLGRGMVTDPGLALAIAAGSSRVGPEIAWPSLLPLVADFWQLVRTRLDKKKQAGRLKQWLNFLRQRYPEAGLAYLALRTTNDPLVIEAWLAENLPDRSRTAADTTACG